MIIILAIGVKMYQFLICFHIKCIWIYMQIILIVIKDIAY